MFIQMPYLWFDIIFFLNYHKSSVFQIGTMFTGVTLFQNISLMNQEKYIFFRFPKTTQIMGKTVYWRAKRFKYLSSLGDSKIKCKNIKVTCTFVQALRLCTGRTARRWSRNITLLFLDHGTKRGEGSASRSGRSLPPGKTRYPGPVWTGAENLAPTGIRFPYRPALSQSLYRLRYPAHKIKCSIFDIPLTTAWLVMKIWENLCVFLDFVELETIIELNFPYFLVFAFSNICCTDTLRMRLKPRPIN